MRPKTPDSVDGDVDADSIDDDVDDKTSGDEIPQRTTWGGKSGVSWQDQQEEKS